ncbi:MAG: hypothetical protein M0R74_19320 [Dehalococcoidia bacterium]|jgi:DNA repair exonuclease SbcCD ATPase subunit|nr:hypothetical protein [Dehalococcoidia bacterium]
MKTQTLDDFSGADIIDSRGVEARIDELESEVTAWDDTKTELEEALEDAKADPDEEGRDRVDIEEAEADLQAHLSDADDIDTAREELKTLTELRDGCGSREWAYGLTLINESYFQEYAQQLADDIGAVNKDMSWPYTCIDWDQAAEELKQDYSSVDFEGETYYYRD